MDFYLPAELDEYDPAPAAREAALTLHVREKRKKKSIKIA